MRYFKSREIIRESTVLSRSSMFQKRWYDDQTSNEGPMKLIASPTIDDAFRSNWFYVWLDRNFTLKAIL